MSTYGKSFKMCRRGIISGESRPLPKGRGGPFEGLSMNVEFCKDNFGRSKKMHYFRKIRGWGGGGGGGGGGAPPLPLIHH